MSRLLSLPCSPGDPLKTGKRKLLNLVGIRLNPYSIQKGKVICLQRNVTDDENNKPAAKWLSSEMYPFLFFKNILYLCSNVHERYSLEYLYWNILHPIYKFFFS